MSANEHGIIAVTGRAHCQLKVEFFVDSVRLMYHNYYCFQYRVYKNLKGPSIYI